MSDSFLVLYDFDILSMIKRKNPSSAVARPNGQPRQEGVARGVRGYAPPPREILNFSLSEMRFAAFSGPFGNFFFELI